MVIYSKTKYAIINTIILCKYYYVIFNYTYKTKILNKYKFFNKILKNLVIKYIQINKLYKLYTLSCIIYSINNLHNLYI